MLLWSPLEEEEHFSLEEATRKGTGVVGSMESKSKIATKTAIGKIGETLPQQQAKPETTPYCRSGGRVHKVSPAGLPTKQFLGEYSLS